jgi:hypothetical protein
MDTKDIEEARAVLQRLLDAIEAGELVASPVELGALVGALEVLKALRETTV